MSTAAVEQLDPLPDALIRISTAADTPPDADAVRFERYGVCSRSRA